MATTMLSRMEFAVGLLIWCGVLWDGFATIILPRTVAPMRRVSGRFYRWSWLLWAAVGRRIRQPGLRLSFLAVYGPLSVVLLLVLWAVLMIVAFTLIYHGLGSRFHAVAGSVGFGTLLYISTVTVFPGVLADSGVRMASDVGIVAFKRLGCRGDRARTSRDLPSVPLDTRQETEAGIATGKLRCLEYTGSLENSEILPLPRQK
jgi:hypothetical protein